MKKRLFDDFRRIATLLYEQGIDHSRLIAAVAERVRIENRAAAKKNAGRIATDDEAVPPSDGSWLLQSHLSQDAFSRSCGRPIQQVDSSHDLRRAGVKPNS